MQISFQFARDLICICIPVELIFTHEYVHQYGALIIHSCSIWARHPGSNNMGIPAI